MDGPTGELLGRGTGRCRPLPALSSRSRGRKHTRWLYRQTRASPVGVARSSSAPGLPQDRGAPPGRLTGAPGILRAPYTPRPFSRSGRIPSCGPIRLHAALTDSPGSCARASRTIRLARCLISSLNFLGAGTKTTFPWLQSLHHTRAASVVAAHRPHLPMSPRRMRQRMPPRRLMHRSRAGRGPQSSLPATSPCAGLMAAPGPLGHADDRTEPRGSACPRRGSRARSGPSPQRGTPADSP